MGTTRRTFLASAAGFGLASSFPAWAQMAVPARNDAAEMQFGQAQYEALIATCGGRYPNRRAQAALTRFAQPLFRASRRPFVWEIVLTDSLEVLAAALPGGKLVITRGLLSYVPHPWELAALIGHEMGHAELSHALNEDLDKARTRQQVAAIIDFAGKVAQQFGTQQARQTVGLVKQFQDPLAAIAVALSGYSPEHEIEADAYILTAFASAGWPPETASHVWHRLLRLYPGDSRSSSLFASHPEMVERIARLERIALAKASDSPPPSANFDELKTYVPTRAI